MARILAIETAAEICSIALFDTDSVLATQQVDEPFAHSRYLTVLIEKLFAEAGFQLTSLDAVAISQGPGSYTGLRIGTSVAKGICYAIDRPLIALDTLRIMANGWIRSVDSPAGLIIPMLDARRMEVYGAVFDASLGQIMDTRAIILDENSFKDLIPDTEVHFIGNGSGKFQPVCSVPGAHFHEEEYLLAAHMINLAYEKYSRTDFADMAYFEPFYLKPVAVTKPRKKLF